LSSIDEARKILEETIKLAKALYGRRWMEMIEFLEDKYEGDPYWVLEHLRNEAKRRGIKV